MAKKAIWVDMDGTLADCGHRLHYINTKPRNFNAFESECHKDPVHTAVAMVVNAISCFGNFDADDEDAPHVLIVSARQGNREEATRNWLYENNIHFDRIYIRTQGDNRKDDIVKKELLDRIRNDGYNVIFAIDDRKRVKKMLVENGVFVFDVNQKDKEY